jgi:6-phosphogluconolactonase
VPQAGKDEKTLVYVGSYADAGSQGIHIFHLDPVTGTLTPTGGISGIANPSFLAIHPDRKSLYAVCEVSSSEGKKSGMVSAFSIHPKSGALTLLNQQSSEGAGPCHLVVDREGKCVLVANYSGGSVTALPIHGDGRLGTSSASVQHKGSGTNPQRQAGPHAHSINVDPANRFAVVADLGLDKLLVYKLDAAKGSLMPNDPPATAVAPGAGPRHFAFHPGGRFAYVINEMASTVTAFGYDGVKGVLTEIHTLPTLPEEFKGSNSTAEVQVSPNGKFLYGSNRGHDSIAIFAIDAATGRLTPVGHPSTLGKTPRNFGIDPTGSWLLAANQGSDTVVVFRIDPETGALKPTGATVKVSKPVCVKAVAFAPQ